MSVGCTNIPGAAVANIVVGLAISCLAVARACWRLTMADDKAASDCSARKPAAGGFAAIVGERPATGQRGASNALLCLAAAVPALVFAGNAMALPLGSIGLLAPQLGLAASIPVVAAVAVGAVAAAATGYTVYRASCTVYRACHRSNPKREDGE